MKIDTERDTEGKLLRWIVSFMHRLAFGWGGRERYPWSFEFNNTKFWK